MAQTLTSLYFHIVFSTKNRMNLIQPEIEDELFGYIGGILANKQCRLLIANGTANHVHLLISLSKNLTLPEVVGAIKRNSTTWIRARGGMLGKFEWQDGYSAFSVGYKQIEIVRQYIAGQKDHHAKRLFEDEMRGFYASYDMAFDERYVWD